MSFSKAEESAQGALKPEDASAIEKPKRIAWLDVVRIIAILMVLVCHTAEETSYIKLYGVEYVPSFLEWFYYYALFVVGRLGVPLFLMVSGALLLGKKKNTNVLHFYKTHVLPLFIVFEIWTVIDFFFFIWYTGRAFDIKQLILQMCFVGGNTMPQMWYLPMIIGIYLAIPFINMVLLHLSSQGNRGEKIEIAVCLFLLAIALVQMFTGTLANRGTKLVSPLSLDVSFFGSPYGFYLLAGYVINKRLPKIERRRVVGLRFLLFAALFFALDLIFMRILFLRLNLVGDTWYTSPFLMVVSVFLFPTIALLASEKERKITALLSALSFAVFLIHYFFLYIGLRVSAGFSLPTPLRALLLFSATLVLSFGFSWLLTRWKPLGKLFFNYRDPEAFTYLETGGKKR